jgi:hypothetical protein
VNNFCFNLFPQTGSVALKTLTVMNVITDAEDVLKTIETVVVHVSRDQPAMTNYTAMRAYEAAITHYHAIARQQQPKPASLTGPDLLVYEAVRTACEARLGRPMSAESNAPALSHEDLVACLRRLKKSVEFWTEQGGRRGYLDFIAQFIP